MSEDRSVSWPAVDVEPRHADARDDPTSDDGVPSILEMAGIDPQEIELAARGDDVAGGEGRTHPEPSSMEPGPAEIHHANGAHPDAEAADAHAETGDSDAEPPAFSGVESPDPRPASSPGEAHLPDEAGAIHHADSDHSGTGPADPPHAAAGGNADHTPSSDQAESPPQVVALTVEPDPDFEAQFQPDPQRVASMERARTGAEFDINGSTQLADPPAAAVTDDGPVHDEPPPENGVSASPRPEPGPRPADHPVRPPLPRIMAIANQKGGVGKTTTAVNLGASLAELGYRVLVVDLDPQGNATTGLGVNARNLQASIYDVLLADLPMEDCIEPTGVRNLFVAPATIDLAGAEIELVPAFSRELRLRRALESLGDEYDFVLIDCPPSLGLLTVNGLAAATEVVVPIQCEYYALEGLGQLMRNVQLVQRNLNPRLELSTIILTMYDARTKLAEQVAREVRKHFGPKVCRNIVPRTVRLSEAPSFGQPILVFDSTSRGALAYRELAKEVSGGAPQRTR
ncbi:MAG TPA: AAA family ATPase [Acidimicrobiales bacterium]|nr:AAA family ATPase [Acidimicrobiales bacterium]